jgi:hypothetical protein
MEAGTSTTKSKAAKEAEPRVSHQAQFSTYEDAPPPEEPQNPPSGHQVVQTPGVAHDGPVESPLPKAKGT